MRVLDSVFYGKDNVRFLNDYDTSDRLQGFFKQLHSTNPLTIGVMMQIDNRLQAVSYNTYQYKRLVAAVKSMLNAKFDKI